MASYIEKFKKQYGWPPRPEFEKLPRGFFNRKTKIPPDSLIIQAAGFVPEIALLDSDQTQKDFPVFSGTPVHLLQVKHPSEPNPNYTVIVFDRPLNNYFLPRLLMGVSRVDREPDPYPAKADWSILFDDYSHFNELAGTHSVLNEAWVTFVHHAAEYYEIFGGDPYRGKHKFLGRDKAEALIPVAVISGETTPEAKDRKFITHHLAGPEFAQLRDYLVQNINLHRASFEPRAVFDTLAGLLAIAYLSPEITNSWPKEMRMSTQRYPQKIMKAQMPVLAKMFEHQLVQSRVVARAEKILDSRSFLYQTVG